VARGLFVTGTDTGVGKTVVSSALMCRYRKRFPVRYWKPIQTGVEQDDDSAEVTRLAGCTAAEIVRDGIRLPRPVSPHHAAQLAGTRISVDWLLTVKAGADVGADADVEADAAVGADADVGADAAVGAAFRRPDTFWIVEGAGGILVPISDDEVMADLIARLGLPAVVVSRTALGTINHTLLTLEALRARRIMIAGVVMAGQPDAAARLAIEHHGRTGVIELPVLDPLTPAAVAAWAAEASPTWLI
jgi:dethiobiotin synthetase